MCIPKCIYLVSSWLALRLSPFCFSFAITSNLTFLPTTHDAHVWEVPENIHGYGFVGTGRLLIPHLARWGPDAHQRGRTSFFSHHLGSSHVPTILPNFLLSAFFVFNWMDVKRHITVGLISISHITSAYDVFPSHDWLLKTGPSPFNISASPWFSSPTARP